MTCIWNPEARISRGDQPSKCFEESRKESSISRDLAGQAIDLILGDEAALRSAEWAARDLTLDVQLAAWMSRIVRSRFPEEWEEGLHRADWYQVGEWARARVRGVEVYRG